MKIEASYRVVVELPSNRLYFTEIDAALDEMQSKGVPGSAELRFNLGDQGNTVTAVWEKELDSIN